MDPQRILLVEDDADLRGLMRRHLTGHGHLVLEAGTVAAALDALQESRPDIMVLDIGLPDGSGWDVVRWVRSQPGSSFSIVVCSSHEPSTEDLDGYAIEGYIPKPFDIRTLVERLGAALGPAAGAYAPSLAAAEADDSQAAFYSSLAHDVRTPMATLRTAVESLMADDVKWDEEARSEFLSAIAVSADRVERYARDVVDLARLDAGALRPRCQRIHPGDVTEEVTRSARAARPRIAVRLPEILPYVLADPALVQRVLNILIENALQHSPAGAKVLLELVASAGAVVWRVSDAGPGVPAEDRERIFSRCYRMSARAQGPSGGPRLSLYIGREMAKLLSGRIWVEEAAGGGACFCFELPAL